MTKFIKEFLKKHAKKNKKRPNRKKLTGFNAFALTKRDPSMPAFYAVCNLKPKRIRKVGAIKKVCAMDNFGNCLTDSV